MAGEKSGWAKRKKGGGRGMGIAAHRSFNTYVASVVEVEVDGRGNFSVPRIEQVVDAGVIVNPDRVRSQMEGAAVMAVGLARNGEITAANGRIQQTNFHQFQVARMNDAPRQVNVHFVESDALPTGRRRAWRAAGDRGARPTRSSRPPASASASCRCRRRSWSRQQRSRTPGADS